MAPAAAAAAAATGDEEAAAAAAISILRAERGEKRAEREVDFDVVDVGDVGDRGERRLDLLLVAAAAFPIATWLGWHDRSSRREASMCLSLLDEIEREALPDSKKEKEERESGSFFTLPSTKFVNHRSTSMSRASLPLAFASLSLSCHHAVHLPLPPDDDARRDQPLLIKK